MFKENSSIQLEKYNFLFLVARRGTLLMESEVASSTILGIFPCKVKNIIFTWGGAGM